MAAAARKTLVLVVMLLALLAGLFGWTMRMQMAAPLHHTSIHSSQMADGNKVCPPPPFDCG
jgi:hypothetical protein